MTPVNVRSVSQIDGVVSSFSSNIAAGKTIVSFESNAVVRVSTKSLLTGNPNDCYGRPYLRDNLCDSIRMVRTFLLDVSEDLAEVSLLG